MMPRQDVYFRPGKLIDAGLSFPELQTIYHHLIYLPNIENDMDLWYIMVNPPIDNWKMRKDIAFYRGKTQ